MRRYLLIGAAAALLAVPALAFGRATTTVTVGDNFFNPKAVTKTVGTGAVHWQWGNNGTGTAFPHNVRQDDKLFRSGSVTTNKPGGFDVVPSAGSFHYYCELHGSRSGGMAGTIKIRPQIFNKPATAGPFGVRWAPTSSNTGGKFDVRYRVDSGTWKVWKNDTTARQATFGLNGQPVRVRAGHTYDVQARSERSTDTSKTSGWSPLARVRT